MNRKQGQSQRMQGSQSSFRGNRTGQMNQMNQNNQGRHMDQGIDSDFDLSGSHSQRGMSSDDSYQTARNSRGYNDADYEQDRSTYNPRSSTSLNGRSPMSYSSDSSYGSEYGDFETNDRARSPRASQGDRGLNREGSSSERFGYPSNLNAWSGADRSYNSGRTAGRMGQSGQPELESDMYSANRSVDNNDWGSSHSFDSHSRPSTSWSQSSNESHFGKGPKGYKRSDDRIKEEVCETLARNPRIDASDIEVTVNEAMVTLSGTVNSKDIRRAAEMAIENLSGVDDVKNEIRVKKDSSTSMSSDATSSSIYGTTGSSKSAKADSLSSKGSSRI